MIKKLLLSLTLLLTVSFAFGQELTKEQIKEKNLPALLSRQEMLDILLCFKGVRSVNFFASIDGERGILL